MGYKLVKFNVTPEENEQIDAVIKVPKESRSVLHGIVIDECNVPIKDAVVKLLSVNCKSKRLEPITHTFTDENGEFLFGPLCPHVKYIIKVWINHVKTREIVIGPDKCNHECVDECINNPPCDTVPCDNNPCSNKNCDDKYDYRNERINPKIIMNNKNYRR